MVTLHRHRKCLWDCATIAVHYTHDDDILYTVLQLSRGWVRFTGYGAPEILIATFSMAVLRELVVCNWLREHFVCLCNLARSQCVCNWQSAQTERLLLEKKS